MFDLVGAVVVGILIGRLLFYRPPLIPKARGKTLDRYGNFWAVERNKGKWFRESDRSYRKRIMAVCRS